MDRNPSKQLVEAVEKEMKQKGIKAMLFGLSGDPVHPKDIERRRKSLTMIQRALMEMTRGSGKRFSITSERRLKPKKSSLARVHIQDAGDVVHIKSLVNFMSIDEMKKKYGEHLALQYLEGPYSMYREGDGGTRSIYLRKSKVSVAEGQTMKSKYFVPIYAEMQKCGKCLSKLVQESKKKQSLPIKVLEI